MHMLSCKFIQGLLGILKNNKIKKTVNIVILLGQFAGLEQRCTRSEARKCICRAIDNFDPKSRRLRRNRERN